jgi:hypothetical protein
MGASCNDGGRGGTGVLEGGEGKAVSLFKPRIFKFQIEILLVRRVRRVRRPQLRPPSNG